MSAIPLSLHLTKFIQTGKFDFVRLGMTKKELEAQHFPPEMWGTDPKRALARIWRYGNFELHFDDRQQVSTIYNDYVPALDGGKSITIEDWWILKNGQHTPSLREALESLNTLGLDYRKETNNIGSITIEVQSGVYMMFEKGDEEERISPSDYQMSVIGKDKDSF